MCDVSTRRGEDRLFPRGLRQIVTGATCLLARGQPGRQEPYNPRPCRAAHPLGVSCRGPRRRLKSPSPAWGNPDPENRVHIDEGRSKANAS